MTTVELFPTPLPHPPAPYEEWREYWPDYLSTYDTIRGAERHADEQVGADPSNLGARDDVMFARLAGYLLLEFFNRRATLTEGPCASLVKQIGSSPREFGDSAHDIVFKVGRWHFDHLLRPCTFNHFHALFRPSQFPHRLGILQGVSNTLLTPFAYPLRHVGRYGSGVHEG